MKLIILALLILLYPSWGSAGTYFNDVSVYAGIEQTTDVNPYCHEQGLDNKTASNLGLRGNLFQSDSKSWRINMKYTHHSCVFNADKKSYDAFGIEFEKKIWTR